MTHILVVFFVCGMMGRFGYDSIIIYSINWKMLTIIKAIVVEWEIVR